MPLIVPTGCNGPPASGNGGYAAGLFAGLVGEPAEASLRRPIPLASEMRAVPGDPVAILHGDELVATVRAAPEFTPRGPEGAAVTLEQARTASARYRGARDGELSHCFVCGLGRQDSLRVYSGQVADRALVATPWTARRDMAGPDGAVRSELVWSVLDCPTFAAAFVGGEGEIPLAYTASMTAQVVFPVPLGEELVVVGWPLRADGRKHWARSAVLTVGGVLLAAAEALLIEPRPG